MRALELTRTDQASICLGRRAARSQRKEGSPRRSFFSPREGEEKVGDLDGLFVRRELDGTRRTGVFGKERKGKEARR